MGWATSQEDLVVMKQCDLDSTHIMASVPSSAEGPALDILLRAMALQDGNDVLGDVEIE